MVQSNRVRCVGHLADKGERRNMYKVCIVAVNFKERDNLKT